jgi:electron transfer flavoprotein alpha subunit
MLSIAGRSVLRLERTRLRPGVSLHNLSALARLLSSLAILEQRDGKFIHGSTSAVTAAKKLGGPVTAFVAGGNIKPVAEEAAKVAGVDRIIAVDNLAYDKVSLRLCVC